MQFHKLKQGGSRMLIGVCLLAVVAEEAGRYGGRILWW